MWINHTHTHICPHLLIVALLTWRLQILFPEMLNAGLINSCRVPFAYVWLPYSHHLADDANYSNLRWLWVFFLLVLFCLLVFSHVFHQTVGYVHSQATVVGMPTWWLGWTFPTLPWEPWTCLSNLCSYLPLGMIAVSLQDDHKLVCS